MEFRHLRPSDLHGPVDIPGLDAWLKSLGPLDTTLLILAPGGTGKAAAVGAIAEKLDREVVLCNLLQMLDYADTDHQLHNLLVACESHQHKVVYLDKLDRLIEGWDRQHPDLRGRVAATIRDWIRTRRGALQAEGTTVVFTGREPALVPPDLIAACDKVLTAEAVAR
jgi:AAA+ superfamily predicted ATPase